MKLAPGTLYEAFQRLEQQGIIEALEAVERCRPYRLTAAGGSALQAQLDDQQRVTGLRRLASLG